MKKLKIISIGITILLFTLLIPTATSGQERMGEFGIRYMPTFSSIDIRTSDGSIVEGSVKMSHGFGVMMGINLSDHIGIQGEVNYYGINQKYRDQSISNEVIIRYINIPLLLSVNTGKSRVVNLNLVAGPQFGINVGSDLKTSDNGNNTDVQAVAAVKKGDVGFAYGAGLEFALNSDHTIRLDLGYRGFYGFVDMDSSTDDGTYNVIVKASRKANGAYAGLTFLF